MKTEVSFPELGLVAMTRAFFGAGIAFVIADRMDTHQRKAVGWTLTAVGALTTIPLMLEILSHRTDKRRHNGAADEAMETAPFESETIAEAELEREL